MRVMVINMETSMVEFNFEVDSIAPIAGDIIAFPVIGVFQVLQRSFVLEEKQQKTGIVDLKAKKMLEPVIQLTCQKVAFTEEDENAVSH